MSDYPSEWRVEMIGEICEIHDSKRIPLSSDQRRDRKGPYPYYGANNIQDSIDDFIFDFDAVLLAEDGGYYDEYETRDIAQYATGRYWVNNHAHILTGGESLDTKFLYFSLVRKNICPWINTGTRAKLNQADLRQIEIAVPPLPEQKKIAEILSSIDRSIAINTNKIKSLETLYTSLLADSLKKLPGNCLEMQLSDACKEVFLGLTSKVDYVENEGIPLIRASNIKSGMIDFNSARQISHKQHLSLTKYRKAGRGDVLVTKSGSLGECAIVHTQEEFSIYESIVCLKPKPGIVSTEYLFHAMQCNAVKDQFLSGKVGSAVAHLNLNDFRQIALPVPSLEDQKVISTALDAVQKTKDHLQADTEKKIFLKNALSTDLLSGCKRVSI